MYPDETNLRGFIDRYTFTSTDGCVKDFWYRYYRIITTCNTVIYKSKGIEGDPKLISQYVGKCPVPSGLGLFQSRTGFRRRAP